MILAFFLVSLLLSCLPLFHSDNISRHICPESFTCPELTPFKYPFYNVTDKHCGLIKITCTSKGGKIQLGGQSYKIVGKYDYAHNSDILLIRNRTFEELVNNKSCDALMNNLTPTSPNPLLYSISLFSNITLLKCTKNLTSAQHKDAYFDQHDYRSYNTCTDYTYYYNYLNGTVPNNLPNACQVVHLPLKLPSSPGFDETNIFSLISYFPSIFFELPSSKRGHQCDTKDANVRCSNAIKTKRSQEWARTKILVVAGSIAILTLAFVIFMIWRHCKSNPFSYVSSKKKSQHLDEICISSGVSVFSYKELEDATQNFSPSHELGDGGFGVVYHGKLQDGREVAVKKLHEHKYNRLQQFLNEVEILTKLKHPNLVVLYGCTSRQSTELLLVYEYVSNGTVADHLHGELTNPKQLTWPMRMSIAIETANALVYLHASEIIHRDVKTSNILLDHNFSVKVADFGLSRLIPDNATHVSTCPQGTPGYVDPQYHQCYQLTDKSDVYSFGVVLIELISSMVAVDFNRPREEISLANLALNRIQRHAVNQLIDPDLNTNPETMNMITLVAELAFQCLQYDSDMRPTMNEVLDMLMEIQSSGRVGPQTTKVIPLCEPDNVVVLLKDFLRSPP